MIDLIGLCATILCGVAYFLTYSKRNWCLTLSMILATLALIGTITNVILLLGGKV